MADALIIETSELRKTYDGVEALRGMSFGVPAGSICGFLGRNGAGKTTTLKALLGMARPTSGEARVFGLDATGTPSSLAIRRRTGFVSEEKDLYGYMTVAETIRFTASFFPRWRQDLADQYLRALDLPSDRAIKALSRGTRTKIALLLALCRDAELLILDEPTSGLDPAATEQVLQMLIAHGGAGGTTVFFSSHQIAEVDQIADHVVIVDAGRAVLAGPIDDLRERFCRVQLVFDGDAPDTSFRSSSVQRVWRTGRVLTVLSNGGAADVLEEARALHPVATEVIPVTLKEIFLETVGREA